LEARTIFTILRLSTTNGTIMGKGDRKTRRGKLFMGSYGVLRPRRKKHGFSVLTSTKKKTAGAEKSTPAKTRTESKPAPEPAPAPVVEEVIAATEEAGTAGEEKKPVPKKTADAKPAEKKEAEKKEAAEMKSSAKEETSKKEEASAKKEASKKEAPPQEGALEEKA
jgi:ribosomal small subunit protein bTHX